MNARFFTRIALGSLTPREILLLVFLALSLARCSNDPGKAETVPTDLELDAVADVYAPTPIERLRSASSTIPQVRADPLGRVRQAVGSFATTGDTTEERARSFLRQHAAAFGLGDSDAGLVVERELPRGVVFGRVHQGIPVFGAHVVVTLDTGQVTFVSTALPGELSRAATVAKVDADQAARAAASALGVADTTDRLRTPELVLLDTSMLFGAPDAARLAWRVEVHGPSPAQMAESFVDATTGRRLFEIPLVATDLERSIYHALYEADYTRMIALANDSGPALADIGDRVPSDLWPTRAEDADGWQAFENLRIVYDYMAGTFGRELWTGDGKAVAFVHFKHTLSGDAAGQTITNASYWQDTLFFSDGMATLDILAHEAFHGVVEHTAALHYTAESGALNEHFADFSGALADPDTRWTIGDGSALGVIRSLSDPTAHDQPRRASRQAVIADVGPCDDQGACPVADPQRQKRACVLNRCLDTSEDAGHVHTNSGIPNHAFHLAVEGGTHSDTGIRVRAIGLLRAEQIWFRALEQRYLLPAAQLEDLPLALLRACMDLIGKAVPGGDVIEPRDCGAVNNAMAAVELLWAPDRDEDMFPDSPDGDNCAPPPDCDARGDCADYHNPDQTIVAACAGGGGGDSDAGPVATDARVDAAPSPCDLPRIVCPQVLSSGGRDMPLTGDDDFSCPRRGPDGKFVASCHYAEDLQTTVGPAFYLSWWDDRSATSRCEDVRITDAARTTIWYSGAVRAWVDLVGRFDIEIGSAHDALARDLLGQVEAWAEPCGARFECSAGFTDDVASWTLSPYPHSVSVPVEHGRDIATSNYHVEIGCAYDRPGGTANGELRLQCKWADRPEHHTYGAPTWCSASNLVEARSLTHRAVCWSQSSQNQGGERRLEVLFSMLSQAEERALPCP